MSRYLTYSEEQVTRAVYAQNERKFLGLECRLNFKVPENLPDQTRLVYKARRFTLVPNKFFQAENAPQILALGSIVEGQTRSQQLHSLKSRLLYDDPTGRSCDYAQPGGLITWSEILSHVEHETFVHLHLDVSFMYVICIKEEQLVLANAFSFTHRDDILFNILSCAHSSGIDLRQSPLLASGFLRLQTELFKLLTRYTEELIPLNRFAGLRFSEQFSKVPKHYFADVFTLPLCEL